MNYIPRAEHKARTEIHDRARTLEQRWMFELTLNDQPFTRRWPTKLKLISRIGNKHRMELFMKVDRAHQSSELERRSRTELEQLNKNPTTAHGEKGSSIVEDTSKQHKHCREKKKEY